MDEALPARRHWLWGVGVLALLGVIALIRFSGSGSATDQPGGAAPQPVGATAPPDPGAPAAQPAGRAADFSSLDVSTLPRLPGTENAGPVSTTANPEGASYFIDNTTPAAVVTAYGDLLN